MLGQDGACSVIVPADGKYVVQVRESAYGGNGGCAVSAARRHFPAADRRRAGRRQAGRGSRSHLPRRSDRADQAEGQAARDARRSSACSPQDAGGICPSPVPFRLSAFGNVVEADDNDTPQTGTPVPALPAALNGVIAKPGEVDYYRFTAKKGQTFDVHCLRPPARLAARFGDDGGVVGGGALAANDDAIGPDSYFRFTAPSLSGPTASSLEAMAPPPMTPTVITESSGEPSRRA